jgi:hypothetical protein
MLLRVPDLAPPCVWIPQTYRATTLYLMIRVVHPSLFIFDLLFISFPLILSYVISYKKWVHFLRWELSALLFELLIRCGWGNLVHMARYYLSISYDLFRIMIYRSWKKWFSFLSPKRCCIVCHSFNSRCSYKCVINQNFKTFSQSIA